METWWGIKLTAVDCLSAARFMKIYRICCNNTQYGLLKQKFLVRTCLKMNIIPTVSLSCRHADACSLSYDIGGCWNYTMKWFFDSNERRCSHFWYGGCGGNANRFETEEECGNLCLSPGGKSHPTRKRQYHWRNLTFSTKHDQENLHHQQ